MRITPIDIQQQQFKSRLMGYDKTGVDQFLEILAGEMERVLRQNQDLQEELAHARSALAEMREREATLKETLLTTQKVTDELKANARREAEVLLWVSYGKSSGDISDVLEISPRTVQKHLEHVYVKLGVETRSAAAAMAIRVIEQ